MWKTAFKNYKFFKGYLPQILTWSILEYFASCKGNILGWRNGNDDISFLFWNSRVKFLQLLIETWGKTICILFSNVSVSISVPTPRIFIVDSHNFSSANSTYDSQIHGKLLIIYASQDPWYYWFQLYFHTWVPQVVGCV